MPHDIPVAGFGGDTVNYLRLYAASPSSGFDIGIFNEGDYIRAVERKIYSENISKILYPSDSMETGRELRLIQEYFLVACSLRDIVRRYLREHGDFEQFPHKVAIQLNDTHPALAVAELMRILVDENKLPWARGLGHNPRHRGLYQPHALAGGPGKMAGGPPGTGFAPALADHLRDQPAVSGAGGGPLPPRCGPGAADVPGGGRPHQAGAHGPPGRGGLPFGERGVGPAHGIAEARHVPGFLSDVAGTLQQQDQRRHSPPLALKRQPRTGRVDHRHHRRCLDHRPFSAPAVGALGPGWGLSGRVPALEKGQQGAVGAPDLRQHPGQGQPRRPL